VKAVIAVVVLAALALPASAFAHGRTATVALDYRLRLVPAVVPGVQLRILDGDRDLQARVTPGTKLIVRGYLREPVIRIDSAGIWVNASSPTAQENKLVPAAVGWVKVGSGSSYAWHDHRLAPPPTATGESAFPLTVDGHSRTVSVFFTRVPRPVLWPWLAGAVLFGAAVMVAVRRRSWRSGLTLGLALAAGIAAALASIAFAVRDQPSGGSGWLQVGVTVAIVLLLAAVLIRSTPRRRLHAAGVVGAIAAVAVLSSLPVFWHGVTISALPATAIRFVCAVALLCGTAAAMLSFLPDFDEPVRAA
jgi:hypothetical protein